MLGSLALNNTQMFEVYQNHPLWSRSSCLLVFYVMLYSKWLNADIWTTRPIIDIKFLPPFAQISYQFPIPMTVLKHPHYHSISSGNSVQGWGPWFRRWIKVLCIIKKIPQLGERPYLLLQHMITVRNMNIHLSYIMGIHGCSLCDYAF